MYSCSRLRSRLKHHDTACLRSIEIDLPIDDHDIDLNKLPPPELVDVTVPFDATPGSEFLVELADGARFFVATPEGCVPGDMITIEVPPMTEVDENEPPTGAQTPLGGHYASRDSLDAAVGRSGGLRLNSEPRLNEPAVAVSPPAQKLGRYFECQILEVERSDGNCSRCSVEDYDELGDTYTVLLSDGRRKYFVEDGALRQIRCGSFVAGAPVHLAQGGGLDGRVDAFDDESSTYTVRLADGRCRFYVEEDELTSLLRGD